VSTEPAVQERKLILVVGAGYPVYGAIKLKKHESENVIN